MRCGGNFGNNTGGPDRLTTPWPWVVQQVSAAGLPWARRRMACRVQSGAVTGVYPITSVPPVIIIPQTLRSHRRLSATVNISRTSGRSLGTFKKAVPFRKSGSIWQTEKQGLYPPDSELWLSHVWFIKFMVTACGPHAYLPFMVAAWCPHAYIPFMVAAWCPHAYIPFMVAAWCPHAYISFMVAARCRVPTYSFTRRKKRPRCEADHLLRLVPRWRICGAISPLPHTLLWCTVQIKTGTVYLLSLFFSRGWKWETAQFRPRAQSQHTGYRSRRLFL
jgi:hypothetical protein